MGGFYQQLVGSLKLCLKKVVGKAFSNHNESKTLLIEIEQTSNSRPFRYLSDNNDDHAIAPSDVLYGRVIACRNCIYFDTEKCEKENTLLNKYKCLKMTLFQEKVLWQVCTCIKRKISAQSQNDK